MKRIFLLLVTNLAVLAVLTIVAHLIGLDQWLAARGSSLGALLAFAAVFGFGGAFISLLMSKWMARRAMGVRVISQPATPSERWLLDLVARLARVVSQILLGILANMIVMAFSRWREFRADRGGAHLAGIPNMIAALEALKRTHEPLPSHQFAAFGIVSGPASRGIQRLFMSHPPLDERIAALRALTVA